MGFVYNIFACLMVIHFFYYICWVYKDKDKQNTIQNIAQLVRKQQQFSWCHPHYIMYILFALIDWGLYLNIVDYTKNIVWGRGYERRLHLATLYS